MEEDFFEQNTLHSQIESQESSPSSSIQVPKKIGPYPILALLKQSKMSLVFLAHHPDSKQALSIKVLSPNLLDQESLVKSFLEEADIITMAQHDHIVKIYGHGQWEQGLYIAMEYIQGSSLHQIIKSSKKIPEKRAFQWLMEIVSATAHLHSHGIVHRDLKPENILINHEEKAFVIDFGISQITSDDRADTEEYRVQGTPAYMSPEQIENPSAVSFPSDIYAIGRIACELFSSKFTSGEAEINALPVWIQAIIKKCLNTQIHERYEDIVDLFQELKQAEKNKENHRSSQIKQQQIDSALPKQEEEKNLKEEKSTEYAKQESQILQDLEKEKKKKQVLWQDLHKQLLPPQIPSWNDIEIGQAFHNFQNMHGLYFDFFTLKNQSYGFIMSESIAQDESALVYISMLRGMIRSLSWSASKPVELVAYLNNLLSNDPMDQMFTLSYIIIRPKEKSFDYISCGYGSLWYYNARTKKAQGILADNIALGIDSSADFIEKTHEFEAEDLLILSSFHKDENSQNFAKYIEKEAQAPCKKIAETISKKHQKYSENQKPLCITSFKNLLS